MASEPRLWLGLRRLDALGLGLCALALGGASATAAVLPATIAATSATDPSAAGVELTWQRIDGPGMLRTPSGALSVLPGRYPALGGSLIAWEDADRVTIAAIASLSPVAVVAVTGLSALAVSDGWVVFRDRDAQGGENLVGVSLANPSQRRYVYGSRRAGEVGRPSLDGSTVVFTIATRRRNAIETMDLATGRLRVLRSVSAGASLGNPALLDGQLVYERADRCVQQLLIGSATGSSADDRVLLSLPSTARRDRGYQRGYKHAYNRASLCPNRGPGLGGSIRLGSTALSASAAYLTEIPSNPGEAQILVLQR